MRRIIGVQNVPDREGFAHRGELAVMIREHDRIAWGYGDNRAKALRDAEHKIALGSPKPTIN